MVEDYHLRRPINERLEMHDRIALYFSGGKDSLACVFLCKSYFDRITIYHVDTGDYLPEQHVVIDEVESGGLYKFVRIETNVEQWIDRHGLPSDLLPYSSHPLGYLMGMAKTALVPRFDCCFHNLMAPLYERVRADGNTLLIRGSKASDMPTLPAQDGSVDAEGIELYLPLQDWTDEQVLNYLRLCGVTPSRIYEYLDHGLSCATCPAWWSEHRGEYLKQFHPALFRKYDKRLQQIIDEIAGPLAELKREAGVA
jgi:phosphoadenosine phosphosulfate reductase